MVKPVTRKSILFSESIRVIANQSISERHIFFLTVRSIRVFCLFNFQDYSLKIISILSNGIENNSELFVVIFGMKSLFYLFCWQKKLWNVKVFFTKFPAIDSITVKFKKIRRDKFMNLFEGSCMWFLWFVSMARNSRQFIFFTISFVYIQFREFSIFQSALFAKGLSSFNEMCWVFLWNRNRWWHPYWVWIDIWCRFRC